jgi:hypothetical protein
MTEAWDEREREHASTHDAALIVSLNSARALVATSLPTSAETEPSKDFWSACANLGRLYAEHEASIDFAIRSLANLARAQKADGPPWLEPARGALLESFTRELGFQRERAALLDQAQALVVLRESEFALHAPKIPDAHDVQAWADFAITHARKRGAKTLIIQGQPDTFRALTEGAAVAGIEVLDRPTRSWFRFW